MLVLHHSAVGLLQHAAAVGRVHTQRRHGQDFAHRLAYFGVVRGFEARGGRANALAFEGQGLHAVFERGQVAINGPGEFAPLQDIVAQVKLNARVLHRAHVQQVGVAQVALPRAVRNAFGRCLGHIQNQTVYQVAVVGEIARQAVLQKAERHAQVRFLAGFPG